MKDELRVLTCKARGLSHQPTEVEINWEGLDHAGLMVLARHAIVHALQASWKKSQEKIPEKISVSAAAFVHSPVLVALEDRPSLPKAKRDWMDTLMKDLSQEERNSLLRELEG